MAKFTLIAKQMYQTRFYRIWNNMRTRCNNKKLPSYYRYGGRGISYDPAWQDFDGFYADMYSSYKDGLQLERKDNDKGYSRENCTWATPKQQSRNRCSNRMFTINGETLCFAEWIERFGLKSSTVRQRYYGLGWSVERSLGLGGVSSQT